MKDEQYFAPGDIVRIKHGIENKPRMVVKAVERIKKPVNEDGTDRSKTLLLGIQCYWFDKNQVYHSHRFSTKDLEFVHISEPIRVDMPTYETLK